MDKRTNIQNFRYLRELWDDRNPRRKSNKVANLLQSATLSKLYLLHNYFQRKIIQD
jgi:hypothetical protein